MRLPTAGPSTGQTCGLVLISAVLLQSICVALQDTYSKSGIACLTGEDLGTFIKHVDLNENEERESDPCWQVKWQLGKLIKKKTTFHLLPHNCTKNSEPENEDSESDPLALSRNPKQMVQYVYKLTTYPEPILLMKSARTSCWSKKAEYGLYSIYQGGVFQLKRDDKIFVSVSNEDIVDMDKEASFFGAFLIS
ncbi:hypothetical protein KIL84_023152 [Mauremys mutica]|uniref:Tumor necrosis factor ligand superfamily member 10 n=1 Tax=Mauremys mutica TaxID=74926 RepID=A0A9D3WQP9_9SAUR|nr:hypothetical protein KIL84_023152 [Mauremys mutica]